MKRFFGRIEGLGLLCLLAIVCSSCGTAATRTAAKSKSAEGMAAKGTATKAAAVGERALKDTLTIVSYNVGVFSKTAASSIALIASMMKEDGADVVALNEIDSCTSRTGNIFQIKEFAKEMGEWRYLFSPAIPYLGGSYGDGIAAAPRFKIQRVLSFKLPQAGGAETRALAVTEYSGFVFAATHLDHVSDSARVVQAKTINDWLINEYSASPKPVFLCGDLNAEPDDVPVKVFDSGWIRLSPAAPTHTAVNPRTCIDYVFVMKNSAVCRLLDSKVCDSFAAGDVKAASDHLPVLVKVEIDKTR